MLLPSVCPVVLRVARRFHGRILRRQPGRLPIVALLSGRNEARLRGLYDEPPCN